MQKTKLVYEHTSVWRNKLMIVNLDLMSNENKEKLLETFVFQGTITIEQAGIGKQTLKIYSSKDEMLDLPKHEKSNTEYIISNDNKDDVLAVDEWADDVFAITDLEGANEKVWEQIKDVLIDRLDKMK